MSKGNKHLQRPSIHHTIGQCNRGRAQVQAEVNKQLVDILSHQALNTICKDTQEPQGQLEIMNAKFGWDKVMSEYAKAILRILIQMPREEFYREELLK